MDLNECDLNARLEDNLKEHGFIDIWNLDLSPT